MKIEASSTDCDSGTSANTSLLRPGTQTTDRNMASISAIVIGEVSARRDLEACRKSLSTQSPTKHRTVSAAMLHASLDKTESCRRQNFIQASGIGRKAYTVSMPALPCSIRLATKKQIHQRGETQSTVFR